MAHPGGRPQEYDRTEVMAYLLEWSQRDNSVNLNGFCGEYSIPSSTVLSMAKESVEFSRTYTLVKNRIAARREAGLLNGTMHVKAYDINIRVYDEFNKAEHRGDLLFQSELKQAESKETAEALAPFTELMKSIAERQANDSKPA